MWRTSACCAEQQPISASSTGHTQGTQFPLPRGPKYGAQSKVPLDLNHLFLSLICLRRGCDALTTIIELSLKCLALGTKTLFTWW